MDREKVKYDIERCICHVPDACRDCSHYKHGEYLDCMEELLKDVLDLLKLQQLDIEALKNTIQGMVEGQCIIAGDKRVDVVRCKDCKNFDKYNVECIKGHNPNPPYNCWFCADGKRKEGR